MQKSANVLMLMIAIIAMATTAQATHGFKNDWLDQYPDACATLTAQINNCSACHGTNYAQDFLDNGESWAAIEGLDSDGDGQLNGQEIASCTKPWDASSLVGNDENTWSGIKNLWR